MPFQTSKRKPQPRYAKLDGKPPAKPRGRYAASSRVAPGEVRETITIPVAQRLGFRVAEFAALLGVSTPTIWRGIRAGKIEVVEQGNMKIIPRSYAVRAGYITDDDKL